MSTSEIIIQLLAAAGGSCGFSLLYRVRGIRVLISTVCGVCVWGIYLIVFNYLQNDLLSTLTAAFFGTIMAEICARVMRSPATVFISSNLIPLVPGGALFRGMNAAVQGNMAQAGEILLHTAAIAILIAAGVYAANFIFPYSTYSVTRDRHRAG